jgi:hypothetical protein
VSVGFQHHTRRRERVMPIVAPAAQRLGFSLSEQALAWTRSTAEFGQGA